MLARVGVLATVNLTALNATNLLMGVTLHYPAIKTFKTGIDSHLKIFSIYRVHAIVVL